MAITLSILHIASQNLCSVMHGMYGGGAEVQGSPPLIKHIVNSIDKPWRQACQPSPQSLAQPSLLSSTEAPFDVCAEWHLLR